MDIKKCLVDKLQNPFTSFLRFHFSIVVDDTSPPSYKFYYCKYFLFCDTKHTHFCMSCN